MIFLILGITICQPQIIDVDFSKSQIWSQNEQNTYNCTFKISESKEKYIYAYVKSYEPNPNLLLMSQELAAVSNFKNQFEQGSTVDMISVLENRVTRFLKITKPNFPLFISVFDDPKISSYTITIQASSEERCDSDCSGNGICSDNGCECQENYVGNNCNTQADQIYDSATSEFYLQNEPIYFYINIGKYGSKTLELTISTDSQQNIMVYIQKSEANFIPRANSSYSNFVQQETVLDWQPLIMSINVPNNIDEETRLVFIVVGDQYTLASSLDVSLKVDSSDQSKIPTTSIIIIVVSISVGIIILITFCCILKTIRRRRQMEKQSQSQKIFIQQSCRSSAQIQMQNHFVNIQVQEINPEETCSICLDYLSNGKQLSQTKCNHNFHQECIVAWALKHMDCPICRCNLAIKV